MNPRKQSVVVMPTAHRPEFLALALLFLGECENHPKIQVFVDHFDDEKRMSDFYYVFDNYGCADLTMSFREPHRPASSGCWNILNSIKDGRELGAEYVFLVEEDVFVRQDFFVKHWEVMTKTKISASCGRICPRFWRYAPGIYTNPGSCLRGSFVDALIPHINDQFFDDTGAYIRNMCPGKPGYVGGLDDGLIRRLLTLRDEEAFHMDPPVCSHVGFMAYDDKMDFCKRIESNAPIYDRIANLKEMFLRLDPTGTDSYAKYIRDLDPLDDWQKKLLTTQS